MTFHPKMAYGATFHKSARELEDEGPPFSYTPENRARFEEIVQRYPPDRRRSAVLPALYLAQYQQGYITAEPLAVEKEGKFKPNLFLLADYGFGTYSTTIETMQETIDKKPEVVKCFVEGSAKGWYNYLYGDNKAANEAIKKDNPDINDEQIAFSINTMKEFGIVDSGDTEKLGIGAMTDERMQSFYDKMVKAKVLP